MAGEKPMTQENKELQLNPMYSFRSTVLVEKRPIDEMRWINLGTDAEPELRFVSDVQLLLNEKRIVQQIGLDNYRNMIAGMVPRESRYSAGAYTDDELFRDIKSRYLQSASELRAYMDSLMSELDNEVDAAKSKQELEELQKRNDELQVAFESFYKNAGTAGTTSSE